MADAPNRKQRRRQRRLARKSQAGDPQAARAAQAFEDGLALHQAGRLAKAEKAYANAVAADRNFAEAHLNLGVVLHGRGKREDAIQSFRRALALDPDMAEAHYGLGALFQDQDKTEDALACFRRALNLNPGFLEALNGRAIAEQKLGNWAEAADSFERALEINPGFTEAANNLGILRHKQGRLEDAMGCFRGAIEARPDYAKAHRNYAHVLLLAGRFTEGWREFQWRWKCSDFPAADRNFLQARWSGQPVDGKTILIWGEQGVGDEVHFASMVPDLVDQGAAVVLESDPRLVALFRRSFPAVTCVGRETPAAADTQGAIDFQIPSGDLGCWLRPDLGSFPGRRSYLVADGERAGNLRTQYQAGGGDILVGIAWISKNPEIGADKSMALMDWATLAALPGVTFVDLQYGDTEAERKAFTAATGAAIVHDDGIDQMADLDAFAAQVAAMDLVISVSNTTVHIAGGLGVPTWVLLNASPLCVWMQDGGTSPWYSSLKLFRQSQAGEWADVIGRIEAALKSLTPRRVP